MTEKENVSKKKTQRKTRNAELMEIKDSIASLANTVTCLASEVETLAKQSHAKNNPVVINRPGEAEATDLTDGDAREMSATGDAVLEPEHIVIPDAIPDKEKLEELRFNEEYITIKVAEVTDENEDPFPYVYVNGKPQAFIPGQEMQVRRKYVEALASSIRETVKQTKYRDSDDNEAYKYTPKRARRYPFNIVEDRSPRAVEFRRRIGM